jgi:outer membrane protein OmpA-like peptidoglycan-associated protein/tetratricopeptide (TPR) repeat protein
MKNWITITLFFLVLNGYAQNVEFKAANFKNDKEGLKKAEDAISKGDESLVLGKEAVFQVQNPGMNFKKALKEYVVAQKFNPSNGLLNFKIAVCYAHSSDPYKSIEFIKKAAALDPACDPFLNYYLAYAYQLEEKFDEAIKSYEAFELNYKKADNFAKFVTQHKNECKAAKSLKASPARVWVDNVSSLNSEFDDFAPSITTDGSEIVLTSNRPNGHTANEIGEFDMDIYSSTLNDGKWSAPKQISGALNSMSDDVSNNLSYDGTKMLIHREVNGQFDIYESKLSGLNWTDPVLAHFQISSGKSNEKYAAYSNDGWSLYFSRDNDSKSNGFDVMFSAMQSRQQKDYGAAVAIGNGLVNSKFNDGPIYMHIDGETMYIASEGNETIGGYDIFISKKVQGSWTKPVNMGYPINTPYDDFFFASTANGKFAYIASNRAGGKGGYDIYKVTFWGPEKKPLVDMEDYLLASIAMPMKDAQVEATVDVNKKSFTVFKGSTIDAMTKKPVEASIEITDNVTGKIIETFTTNSATGKFILTLASGKNYGIAVKADKYLFHSENFDIPNGAADNLVNKVIELKNIAVGSKVALRNIFFDLGKSVLRPESNAELDRLVKLMKDVAGLKIEISGHTDNTGSATINESLSQSRADAVVQYLTSKGIAANRLTSKGYGSSKPVATNTTDDGRQQNRRTEFEIKGN